MKVLVSEKLSEHKYKTPEGYLICTDAILARTGKQSYTKDELFQDGDNTEVNVDRPYDEVMNAKTIASFENKPITFDHPDEDVNVGNYKDYAIGYVRDVHQGKTDKGEDVILGNLVITDQEAINAIEQGDHTDLSCGYDCDIKDDGNGNYSQTNIRGNHLALCEQGRAGIAHIVDSKVEDSLSKKEKELCDYMLENALDDGEDENDLLKKMKVYYSEYSNLARSKSDEVLQYFKSRINDNKIEDATTSKILYGKKFTFDTISGSMLKEGMTVYNPDKGFVEPIFFKILKIHNTDKSDNTFIVSYKAVLVGNSVGTKVISKNKMYEVLLKIDKTTDSIEDSKEMTMSDAIKMLNIVDTYKKVKDAITWSEYEKRSK